MSEATFDMWVKISTFFGATTAAAGGLGATTWLGILGFLIALATLLINWYYKHKNYQIALRKEQRELAGNVHVQDFKKSG